MRKAVVDVVVLPDNQVSVFTEGKLTYNGPLVNVVGILRALGFEVHER